VKPTSIPSADAYPAKDDSIMNSSTSSTRTSTRTLAVLAGVAALSLAGVTACSGSDDSGPDLTSAPDATWITRGGILAPTAPDGDGPTTDDPVPSGFAHTPQGAVLAAINGQVSLATTNDEDWPVMANTILSPGLGKDQWVQARSLLSVTGSVKDPAAFTCFKITDYDDERTQVMLTVTWPDGKKTAQPTQLAWQGNDWRLVLPDQEQAQDAVVADDQTDCTEFSATQS